MPYIDPLERVKLDNSIDSLICVIRAGLENKSLQDIAGNLNYTISRLCGGIINGKVTYSKIAVITGVLENVKQEFYRRVAVPYEESKIKENKDIKEYEN